jgi:hypothetical protein
MEYSLKTNSALYQTDFQLRHLTSKLVLHQNKYEMKKEIEVNGLKINFKQEKEESYISLTDIARKKNPIEPKDVVKNWMRSKSTIEFLGLWEKLNNPLFKGVEFDSLLNESGSNAFTLSPSRWINSTSAIGLISTIGKNGGTFAHSEIALEFASWVSTEFKLYLITEIKRLKIQENNQHNLQWSVQRAISKINYRIHTDAIKENLIPNFLTKEQTKIIYANEADLLNVALFGMTAQEWKNQNPTLEGNIRDQATLEQLVVLSNMESINALFIQQNFTSEERILQLNQVAISQMKSLLTAKGVKFLGEV